MKKTILILSITLMLLVAGCVAQSSPNRRAFGSTHLNFRANLDNASAVPIYPSEDVLLQTLYDPGIKQIHIAYIPNDTENGYYAVTGYELAYKLVFGYKAFFGEAPNVSALELNTTPEQPAPDVVIIWMRGPGAGANQTDVMVIDNIITVEGANLSSEERKYTDLDLAADRLLLSFLWPPQK